MLITQFRHTQPLKRLNLLFKENDHADLFNPPALEIYKRIKKYISVTFLNLFGMR